MLSNNGKFEYVCCRCHNPNIQLIRIYGQKSFECRKCNRWFTWSKRKAILAGESLMLMEDYKFCIGLGLGLLLSVIFMVVVWTFTTSRDQFLGWACAISALQAIVTIGVAHYQFRRKH